MRFLGNRQVLIQVGKETINGVVNTYADGPKGKLLALFGSTDHLEIAVNSGRADRDVEYRWDAPSSGGRVLRAVGRNPRLER